MSCAFGRIIVAALLLFSVAAEATAKSRLMRLAQLGNACSPEGNRCYAPYRCQAGQPPTSGVGCAVYECMKSRETGELTRTGEICKPGECNMIPCSSTCFSEGARCYSSCSIDRCDVYTCKVTASYSWQSAGTVCNEGEQGDCRSYSPCN